MLRFILGRMRGIIVALRGMFFLIKTEHAIILQLVLGLIFITMGIYFRITKVEWILQVFFIGFVLAVESMNTAIEKLCDFIHPSYHKKIGFIKDIAAGAVSFAVITSLINAVIIYTPYILKLIDRD